MVALLRKPSHRVGRGADKPPTAPVPPPARWFPRQSQSRSVTRTAHPRGVGGKHQCSTPKKVLKVPAVVAISNEATAWMFAGERREHVMKFCDYVSQDGGGHQVGEAMRLLCRDGHDGEQISQRPAAVSR